MQAAAEGVMAQRAVLCRLGRTGGAHARGRGLTVPLSCQGGLRHRRSVSASPCLYILISQTWLGRPPPLQIIVLIISIFGQERRARTPGEISEDKGRVWTEEAGLVRILRGRALGEERDFWIRSPASEVCKHNTLSAL